MIRLSCGRIIDGMIMVQKIRGNEKTIAEVAGSMMSMGLHERTDSHRYERIDVVLDFYRDNLIKNPEREKRAVIFSESSRQTTRYVNGGNSCPTPVTNRFLSNSFQKSGKREAQRQAHWKENLYNSRRLLL